jgi:uncharacterized metal-binding protein YceD (DUF177 family)
MVVPEFSMAVPVDRLSATPALYRLDADAAARDRLAVRFGLLALDRLVAELLVRRSGAAVEAEGRIEADAVQPCVVSLEPVAAQVRETVQLRFEVMAPAAAEVELDADQLDILPIESGVIDLGEAVAQSFALALDPYPRADSADLAAARTFLVDEATAAASERAEAAARNPFAILKR